MTEPPSLPAEPAGRTIEPGTYRLLVGFDRAGAQIDADLTFGTRDWLDGSFPIVRVGEFFWVVDIGTTSVVVDAWHQRGASADLVTQVAEVRDSITLVPAVVR